MHKGSSIKHDELTVKPRLKLQIWKIRRKVIKRKLVSFSKKKRKERKEKKNWSARPTHSSLFQPGSQHSRPTSMAPCHAMAVHPSKRETTKPYSPNAATPTLAIPWNQAAVPSSHSPAAGARPLNALIHPPSRSQPVSIGIRRFSDRPAIERRSRPAAWLAAAPCRTWRWTRCSLSSSRPPSSSRSASSSTSASAAITCPAPPPRSSYDARAHPVLESTK